MIALGLRPYFTVYPSSRPNTDTVFPPKLSGDEHILRNQCIELSCFTAFCKGDRNVKDRTVKTFINYDILIVLLY